MIHVSDTNLSLWPNTKTNHSPILQHLATDGTSSHEELIQIGNLLLEVLPKDCDLAIIAAPERLA